MGVTSAIEQPDTNLPPPTDRSSQSAIADNDCTSRITRSDSDRLKNRFADQLVM
jgi:hypothetical protein